MIKPVAAGTDRSGREKTAKLAAASEKEEWKSIRTDRPPLLLNGSALQGRRRQVHT